MAKEVSWNTSEQTFTVYCNYNLLFTLDRLLVSWCDLYLFAEVKIN